MCFFNQLIKLLPFSLLLYKLKKNNKAYRSIYEKSFIGSLFFFWLTAAEATEIKTLNFSHIHWNGTLEQVGNKLCKTKDECAEIVFFK